MPRHAAVLLLALLAAPAAAQTPLYSVTIVSGGNPPPSAGPVSLPLSLNNNGRVVGYGFTPAGQIQAMNWKNGIATPLGGISVFDQTFANRVNILGRIAGAGYTLSASGQIVASHALKWTGGVMSDLGGLGGNFAAALGINDSDQIVGFATTPGEAQTRAFAYDHGVMTALTTLPGATESYAYDISNTGYIAGAAVTSTPARPFLGHAGRAVALPSPAGARAGAANAVNDSGVAVGSYEISLATGEFAAVRWTGGQMLNLGNLGGAFNYAVAADVNTGGQIVGTSNSPHGYTGFVWQGGQMYDLSTLLAAPYSDLHISSANAINDRGQIAAAALIDGRQTAILLTPVVPNVPAPGAVAILAAAGLLAIHRKR